MMKARALVLTMAVAAAAVAARDASACGGCFVSQSESTQVTGHKMILSISKAQTTLYDQITYSGDPASFAWILPVKGDVTFGLSSDALFQALDADTQVSINSPTISCNPGFCNGGFGSAGFTGTGAGGGFAGGEPPVTVIAQAVVGPYQMVQLHSSDAGALENWLATNGYVIPSDVQPVVNAYVTDQFDFLALKLVPGQGVSAMRPVRVTTPGGSPVLPLRMVAAGTGAITPITLWVLGEGRYDTVNLPSTTIDPTKLVWDWDTQSSNYAQLKQAAFDATSNRGWIVEDAEPFSMYTIQNQLEGAVQSNPGQSGYGDPDGGADGGSTPAQALTDDLLALVGNIPATSMWITRLEGELSRAALANDLTVGASASQTQVARFIQVTATKGTAPSCPPAPVCGNGAGGAGGGTGGGFTFWSSATGTGGSSANGSSGGCAVSNDRDATAPILSGIGMLAALAFSRRRRSSR